MISIAIVGTGRLALQLATVFNECPSTTVSLVLGRSNKALTLFSAFPTSSNFSEKITADIVFIAVSDTAIAQVCESINCSQAVVCHLSGSVPMSHLETQRNYGVFYPLQTFGGQKKVDFTDIPILIEANNKLTHNLLEKLGGFISNKVRFLNSEDRKKLHLAAIWVNNFSNFLIGEAEDFCKNEALDFSLLSPLIKKTTENALEEGAINAQTGPARRGDALTIQGHLTLLENKSQKEIYQLLSKAIAAKYTHEL